MCSLIENITCDILLSDIDNNLKNIKKNLDKIPEIGLVPCHCLKNGQLARFRGMIQDMADPVLYLRTYEVVNSQTGAKYIRTGKYKDTLELQVLLNLRMSKQTSMFTFVQKSNKRPASNNILQSSPKKLKEITSKAISDNSDKIGNIENIDKNCSKTIDKKCAPHELRSELIDWNQKYPIINKNIGLSWYNALKKEFCKPYFSELNRFVEGERKKGNVYPPQEKVWSWTQACSMDDIKVVILGQDPYHNPGQAHGLCFSVQVGVPPPPSLLNMYKELETDIEGFTRPNHGYLMGWARQGVLLLNAVLTVNKNSPNSHKDQGWENLTTAIIQYLNDNRSGIVFLLWGAYAQKKADFVNKSKHCILKSVHPSPLSASRGFFGCRHFSKCNEYLKAKGKEAIDWCKLPKE